MSNLERPYKILIGKGGVTHDATDMSDLAEGELAIVKQDGTLLGAGETIANSEFIYIAQGTATLGEPKFSDKIFGAQIKKYSGSSYAAANEQLSYVGYNETAGDIEDNSVAIGEEFSLHLVIKGFDKDLYSKRQLRKSFSYVAEAATQESVANGLKAALVGDDFIQDGATPKAGALIRVDVVNSGSDYGLKFEALAQTPNSLDEAEQVIFEIGLDKGFTSATRLDELGYIYEDGNAPVAGSSEVPVKGTGSYQAVRELEEFAQGFQGITNKVGFPVSDYPKYAEAGVNYNLYVIEHDHVHASGNLEQSVAAPAMTIIAAVTADAGSKAYLEGRLNPYAASAPGAFANVTLA